MEKKLTNKTQFQFPFFWDYKFLSDLMLFMKPLLNFVHSRLKNSTKLEIQDKVPLDEHFRDNEDRVFDERLNRGELKMVMDRLGIDYDPEEENVQNVFGAEEMSELFEIEEEVSMEEMKKVFDVFDENRDGFIDARELQRVLCNLGLEMGSELESYIRMIQSVDQNGDGLVDFDEFVQFMRKSL